MRAKATIIVSLKLMLSQWKQILLMYSIFPLVMVLLMGYFQKDIFKPEINVDRIKVTVIDEDNTECSKIFTELFGSTDLKSLFEVTENGDYVITLQKGFENSLKKLEEAAIRVDEKKRSSRNNEIIVRGVIEEYGKDISQAMTISNKIESMSIDDKERLFSELSGKIGSLEAERAIKDNIQKGETSLTSYEYHGATMITFFVILIAMGCVAGYHLDKDNGSFKRLMSTPITRLRFFNLDMLVFFLASFVYGLVYILTFRILGFAFKGVNPLIIIAILTAQSLCISALAGLIVAFIGKKSANIVMVVILYFQILFGGIFIPIKEVNNEIFTAISKFAPGNLISELYRSSMLYNSFEKVTTNLLSLILVSIVLYLISVIKVKVRWEE